MMDKFVYLECLHLSPLVTVVAIASHLVIYLRYFALIAVDGTSCWSSTVQSRMHLILQMVASIVEGTISGAAEQGGAGGAIACTHWGGLAPPKMTDQSETRWQKKYLAYTTVLKWPLQPYTHPDSKLAQVAAACNSDSNVGSLSNQRVRSSLNYC